MERTGKTFVIVTSDGPEHDNVFLTWTTNLGGYYTTVDWLDEVGEYDLHDSVVHAIDRAKDADSGTLFGWQAPMRVMEVLNFDAAYNHGEDPELREVYTITF